MINKNIFKKMASGISKKSRSIQSPKLMHPEREWGIGLLIAFLIFSLIVIWSLTAYANYQGTKADELSTTEMSDVIYRESLVKNALEDFAKREEERAELIRIGSTEGVPVIETEEADGDNAAEGETDVESANATQNTNQSIGGEGSQPESIETATDLPAENQASAPVAEMSFE